MNSFGVKWQKKGWYAVKQNNQPTNHLTNEKKYILTDCTNFYKTGEISIKEWSMNEFFRQTKQIFFI